MDRLLFGHRNNLTPYPWQLPQPKEALLAVREVVNGWQTAGIVHSGEPLDDLHLA